MHLKDSKVQTTELSITDNWGTASAFHRGVHILFFVKISLKINDKSSAKESE